MNHLDDLPKRHRNHETETKAEAAFQNLISASGDFILQRADRQDYGTDCQVEVVDQASPTNVRLHVQLKGTENAPNNDGTISIQVRRSNFNYLYMQPYSFFACYHLPTDTLRFCSIDTVVRRYEHSGKLWSEQQTLTIIFSEELTIARLKTLASLARSSATASREARFAQATALPHDLPGLVRAAPPNIHIPDDPRQAAAALTQLYESNADWAISTAFDGFLAVLGGVHDAMGYCYMAEINLGMAQQSDHADRILEGIAFLSSKIDGGRFDPAGLQYSIGNGYSALDRHTEAIDAYEQALKQLSLDQDTSLQAQICKNLGSSYERLGDRSKAAELFRQALRHDPHLPEAHFALGCDALRNGNYEDALDYFDQVVFADGATQKRASVSGQRINALFNLGEGRAAFREISSLLSDAGSNDWIWPWCAQQVASFGRSSSENARRSLSFWDRYLTANADCPGGTRERLLNILYLRQEPDYQGPNYPSFKVEFEAGINLVTGEAGAFLWDRLGHWAQDEEDWKEAERCFRKAYDIDGGHYGYCLGTALLFLGRAEESLPLLLEQAKLLQPDDKSWAQLASAFVALGRIAEAVDAYEKAITLNPENASAYFDLGGAHWNAGDSHDAKRVWRTAVERFPDHELTGRLRGEFPFIV